MSNKSRNDRFSTRFGRMPRFTHRHSRRLPSEDECFACGNAVAHTLRDAAVDGMAVAIRCADCLRVYCLGCSYQHFGLKPPEWVTSLKRKIMAIARASARTSKRAPSRKKRARP